MNSTRKAALKECLISLAVMAPIWAFLWAVDYVPSFRRWDPNPAFVVPLIMPAFIALIRGVYKLVNAKEMDWPPKGDLTLIGRRRQ